MMSVMSVSFQKLKIIWEPSKCVLQYCISSIVKGHIVEDVEDDDDVDREQMKIPKPIKNYYKGGWWGDGDVGGWMANREGAEG